jgi:transketolase (EC 2.2.1.1)
MRALLAETAGPERAMADAIRALAIDAVEAAKSGHPGMPMGMADVATVLWTRFLKFDAADPRWPDRDRFVLSAGHGSMLLYALLHLTGHEGMEMEELRNFRQLHSRTPGHPEYGEHPAIETTTGPLGQGIATAVGMAMAERMLAARFGRSLVDHRTWVIASDGDLMEGVSHEAASLAGHLRLARLTVLYDDNAISIDGPTSLACSDDALKRFAAYGWATKRINGHDPAEIAAALSYAQRAGKPTLIACRTIIGFGAPTKGGSAATHGAPLGPEEAAAAKQALGWDAPPFTVPAEIARAWQEAGRRAPRSASRGCAATSARASRRVRTRHRGATARRLARGPGCLEGGLRGREAEARDAPVEPEGARGAPPPAVPRTGSAAPRTLTRVQT